MKELAFIVLSTVMIVSCSSGETSTDFEIRLGEEFIVELEANWSTGYSWHWTNSPQINLVDTVGRDYLQFDTALVGRPGVEVWRFLALAPGEDVLQFGYIEPGSASSSSSESRIFTIKVNK